MPSRPSHRARDLEKRGTWYRDEYADEAYELALLGLTNDDFGAHYGVDARTIDRWIASKPKFGRAIRRGRSIADGEVAKSLYERAKGYSHDAVKIFMPPGAAEPVYAPYVEHYPPDTAAASLWLRNRQPKLWREKTDVEVSGKLTLEALVLASAGAPSDAQTVEGQARMVDDRTPEEP